MGLNDVVSADRVQIGFFGKRNAGKSSLVNRVTNQRLAVVSDVPGTTTDPVKKSMEILPIGPVVIVDTPGFDDFGKIGEERVKQTRKILRSIDIAVLVVSLEEGLTETDRELITEFRAREVPFIIAGTKADLYPERTIEVSGAHFRAVSSVTGQGIYELEEDIAHVSGAAGSAKRITEDLIEKGDVAVLVMPVDSAAPKGRLILPQQQVIREMLELFAVPVGATVETLAGTLDSFKEPPKAVITDSRVFKDVRPLVPDDIYLTSFSILYARYKGNLTDMVRGALTIDRLTESDRILIAEGCTHHRQCGDIGTVVIPELIKKRTGADIPFDIVSGSEFPEDLSRYRLVVHCGGCMLNEREMKYRLTHSFEAGVPMTNYGVLIAYTNGILKRSTEAFPEMREIFG